MAGAKLIRGGGHALALGQPASSLLASRKATASLSRRLGSPWLRSAVAELLVADSIRLAGADGTNSTFRMN